MSLGILGATSYDECKGNATALLRREVLWKRLALTSVMLTVSTVLSFVFIADDEELGNCRNMPASRRGFFCQGWIQTPGPPTAKLREQGWGAGPVGRGRGRELQGGVLKLT